MGIGFNSIAWSLDSLLRTAWLAGTLPILLAFLPFPCLRFYRDTLLGFAKRGKILQTSSHKLTVPQSFFLHFYVLAAVWTTLLLLCTWFYAYMGMDYLASESFQLSTVPSFLMGGFHMFSAHKTHTPTMGHRQKVWRVVFMYLLMEVHVLRRLFETLFVFNYGPTARMHIFGYLTGLFFYIAAPLTLGGSCALEALINTAHQGLIFLVKSRGPQPDYKFDWCGILTPLLKLKLLQWIGIIIFLWGWIHQLKCHMILGSIREHNKLSNGYAIPHGDWFELVSSPHYFAEIVIYTGLLIASEGTDLTIWFMVIFVVTNLTFAAVETNKWYHNKFDNYPRSRRAIIPYFY